MHTDRRLKSITRQKKGLEARKGNMRFLLRITLCTLIGTAGAFMMSAAVNAALPTDNETPLSTADEKPVEIDDLIYYEPVNEELEESTLPFDIRVEALKEAAISFGARAGLAKRTYEIRRELDLRERYLNKIFDFRQLLIAAPFRDRNDRAFAEFRMKDEHSGVDVLR